MKFSTVSRNNLVLEYTTFGVGKKAILCFHGFGRTAEDFKVFEKSLGEEYTFYAFNLFFHGNSIFPINRLETNPLLPEELGELLQEILVKNKISSFSLMGYSLGGKIAIKLTEYFKSRVEEIILIAPDGIKISRWYNFIVRYKFGRFLYQMLIDIPYPYFAILKLAKWFGLMRPKMYNFLLFNMKTRKNREAVYNIWKVFSLFDPVLTSFQDKINENKINALLIFGTRDTVIKPEIGQRFLKSVNNKDVLQFVEGGHELLTDSVARQIGMMINKKRSV